MRICDRLRAARTKLGLSQPEAAIKFCIGLSSYKKYEAGTSEPGSSALAGIANSGIDTNWLLTGEGEMFRNSKPRGLEVFSSAPIYPPADADAHTLRGAVREAVTGVPVDSSYTQGEQAPTDPNAPPVDMEVLEICMLFVLRQNEKNGTGMTPKQLAEASGRAYQVIMQNKQQEDQQSFNKAQSILKDLVKSI